MFNKVLLVEDDEVTNYLTKAILEEVQAPQEIKVALDGSLAHDLVEKEGCPDVIFLDIKMPKMDGFQFLEALEESGKCQDTKVVMLTSSIRPEDKNKAFQFKQVIDYFEKPLTEELVQNLIKVHFS